MPVFSSTNIFFLPSASFTIALVLIQRHSKWLKIKCATCFLIIVLRLGDIHDTQPGNLIA